LAGQIADFACWYLANRLLQTGRLTVTLLRDASKHIDGASKEVSETFVDALVECKKHPANKLTAPTRAITPSSPGSVSSVCQMFVTTAEAAEKADKMKTKAEELLKRVF
jgi:hypothetical protein